MSRCMVVLFNLIACICLVAARSRYLSYILDANKGLRGLRNVAKPSLETCGQSLGICIQSRACPGRNLLGKDASDDCLAHANHVCCQVARVRIPLDMFSQYPA